VRWLLDTSVLTTLGRTCTDPSVEKFIAAQPLDRLYVSSLMFAELRYNIDRLSDLLWRMELDDWLAQKLRPMFDGRVLDISEAVVLRWQSLAEDGARVGHMFFAPELIIAATAVHHGLTIVTRDTKEYKLAGVPVINPWSDQ